MQNKYLVNIKKGMKVVILTSQYKYVTGYVEDIAAGKPFNDAGIMVRLKNGAVGRVKEIILSEPEQNEKAIMELNNLIKAGENLHTEFKADALWSITYNPIQLKESKSAEVRDYGTRASKVIIAKSIAAFLNTDGGNLIIGLRENKETKTIEIAGIEVDLQKTKDATIDGYRRIIIDEIIKAFFPPKIFNHLNEYINIECLTIQNKLICRLKIKRADSRVFLKLNDREIFMIRVDSENRTLDGEKLVDYCIKKWPGR